VSEAAYDSAVSKDPSLTWGDFQRQQVTDFVTLAYGVIESVSPKARVTAAVWGIYKETFGWGGTSQGFYDYYQDSHRWTQEDLIDAIAPMIYWPLTDPKGGWTDYATLADDHLAAAGQRHVYCGMKADYGSFSEIAGEIEYVRSAGGPGVVVFAYSTLVKKGYLDDLVSGPFASPAETPAMGWK
jgi:uncharacterized lipoprotein YddW (UPF0748 family)